VTCIVGDGVIVCGAFEPSEFPRDGVVAVGFGYASLCRDGVEFINGEDRDDYLTGEECERIAAADPGHKWEIIKAGPLSGATWERDASGRWLQTASDEGFA